MGVIKIQDVGYIKPTNEGTQASSGNRANSGTLISLKVAEFTPSLKRNISSEPELASNTPSEVNQGSLENMQFQLICKLKTNDDTDMNNVQHLLDMITTNGYKLMWYDYTSASAENNNGQLIFRVASNPKFGHQLSNGEKSAFTITDNFNHLHVFFFDIQPRQIPNSKIITYTLRGIILKVETSII